MANTSGDKVTMTSRLIRRLRVLGATLLLVGCAATGDSRAAGERREWDGREQVYDVLRAMLHQGQPGSTLGFDTLLPSPDLDAEGAPADLSGEVAVIGGERDRWHRGIGRADVEARVTGSDLPLVGWGCRHWRGLVGSA